MQYCFFCIVCAEKTLQHLLQLPYFAEIHFKRTDNSPCGVDYLPCAIALTNKHLYAIVTHVIKICYSKKLKSQHCNILTLTMPLLIQKYYFFCEAFVHSLYYFFINLHSFF